MKTLAIINPASSGGRTNGRWPDLAARLASTIGPFESRFTSAPGDATQITRVALQSGFDRIIAVGGDGTMNEVVNGFFEDDGSPIAPDAWLGPLPCGTGGDFRRTLGIDKRTDRMVAHMLSKEPRRIDVGRISFVDDEGREDARMFINIASFGLAGIVDRKVNDAPKWMGGTPAFLFGTLRALVGYRNQGVRIRVDDEDANEMAILNLAVANGRYFGGGMHIAPRAEVDDGLFDIVALRASPLESLRGIAKIYRGTHLDDENVFFTRAKKLVAEPLSADDHVLLDIDGEAPGRLPATLTIRAGALALRA